MATNTTTTGTVNTTDFAPSLQNVVQAVASTAEVTAVKNVLRNSAAVTTSPRSNLNISVGAGITVVGTEDATTDTVTLTFAIALITGIIPASGTTATAGTGFTYTHTNGTGIYVFTFSSSVAATPIVLTQVLATAAATSYKLLVSSVSTSGFTLTITDNTGSAADIPFDFLAYPVA